MKYIKRFAAALFSVLLIFSVCGCSSNTEKYIYIAMDEVSTLDPQLVTRDTDRAVVLNIFEGLMLLDANDKPTPALAESYTKEGLEYTFVIRPNGNWDDGSGVTAYDFEFALRRAASPETDAPDFASISCIRGAKEVKNGAPVETLAVYATSKYALHITLEYDDENFLKTLTTPICMPCKEDFFVSCNGKYGRDGNNIMSNGLFHLNYWNSEDFLIRLYRNEGYIGDFNALPAKVYITAAKQDEKLTLLTDNDIDACFISGTDIDTANTSGLNTISYFDKYLFILINKNSALGNDNIRKALSLSIHRNSLSNEMPPHIIPLDAAVQPDAKTPMGEQLYQKIANAAGLVYNPEEAYRLYLDATKQLGAIGSQSIIFPEELNIDQLVSQLAAGWQQSLGCFINMTETSTAGVISAIDGGNYSVAILPVAAGNTNAYDLLSQFKSGNSFGFQNAEFDTLVNSLNTCGDFEQYLNTVCAAQSLLLADKSIIPIAATPTVVCTTTAIESINYSLANKYIDFSTIVKK